MSARRADSPEYRLRVAGVPFQHGIASLLLTVQLTALFTAAFALTFWAYLVIGSTYHSWMFKPYGGFWEYLTVDWYPELFLMAIGLAALGLLLNYLYEQVDA